MRKRGYKRFNIMWLFIFKFYRVMGYALMGYALMGYDLSFIVGNLTIFKY